MSAARASPAPAESALRAIRARARSARTFTTSQAREWGVDGGALRALVRRGELQHFDRGVYGVVRGQRVHDDLVAAWKRVGEDAIVSHRSALELYDVCDEAARVYEFTVPLRRRSRKLGRQYRLHATSPAPTSRRLAGVPTTSPARTIVDCINLISGEQLEMAVARALARGLVTEAQLRAESAGRQRPDRDELERVIRLRGSSLERYGDA